MWNERTCLWVAKQMMRAQVSVHSIWYSKSWFYSFEIQRFGRDLDVDYFAVTGELRYRTAFRIQASIRGTCWTTSINPSAPS